MHWYILGAGAIGRLWACMFEQVAVPTTLILRDPAALSRWQQSGNIELHEAGNTQYCVPSAESSDSTAPIQHLLVTTKAYDTLTALHAIQHRLQPGSQIVLLQNGMGQQEAALELLPDCRFWAATTTAGAWREPPNRLHCVSRGETVIGPLSTTASMLPDGWDRLPLAMTGCPDILPVLWRKLAINCAINPLTAIERCRNGELLSEPHRIQRLRDTCAEVERVAQAAGIELFEEPLYQQAEAVARATGENLSSMLQDVRHNRKTEIEQITGYLCHQARRHGVDTPCNDILLQQIRTITQERELQDD